MVRPVIAAALGLVLAAPVAAGPVSFSSGWNHQRLSLFSANRYSFGSQLGVVSNGAVSIAWTRLPRSEWDARSASWAWRVDQSVPPTDLGRKGGDDRNLSLYFVFLPEAEAERLEGANIRALLGNPSVRVIQYAWGGNHPRGAVIPSPYSPPGQGVTIPLRAAGTGSFSEQVDLASDYARAFGGSPGKLVGLAVSGDSDDTSSQIRGAIANLTLR